MFWGIGIANLSSGIHILFFYKSDFLIVPDVFFHEFQTVVTGIKLGEQVPAVWFPFDELYEICVSVQIDADFTRC
jgi:hypothetical protein